MLFHVTYVFLGGDKIPAAGQAVPVLLGKLHEGKAYLAHVARAGNGIGGLAGGRQRWKQDRNKHRDDADNHKQFHQRETTTH